MDIRKRRLNTAKLVMTCYKDAEKEGDAGARKNYHGQLEKMEEEFGIHFNTETGEVSYLNIENP